MVDVSEGIENYPVLQLHPKTPNMRMQSGLMEDAADETKTAVVDANHFTYVKTNIPGPGCDLDLFSEPLAGCECDPTNPSDLTSCMCMSLFGCAYTQDGRLDASWLEGHVTRPVLECGHECLCSNVCKNRLVQKGVDKSYVVFDCGPRGLGLKTASTCQPIRHLEFVCEYAGEVISAQVAKQRVEENERLNKDNYIIALKEHVRESELCTYIDPSEKGNLGRFINHSCDPNLIMVPVRVNHQVPRLGLFARRDIAPNEELSFDYSGQALCQPMKCSKVRTDKDAIHDRHNDEKAHCFQSSESELGCKRQLVTDNRDEGLVLESSKKIKLSHEQKTDLEGKKSSDGVESTLPFDDGCTDSLSESWAKGRVQLHSTNGNSSTGNSSSIEVNLGSERVPCEKSSRKVYHRKQCLCGSESCHGFLPFDDTLLVQS